MPQAPRPERNPHHQGRRAQRGDSHRAGKENVMSINGQPPAATLTKPAEPAARAQQEDTEVEARATRRRYSTRFKLNVLQEVDKLEAGQVGAYLRRKGLYWSILSTWRRQREEGSLAALSPRKRGRRPKQDPLSRRVTQLEREKAQLQEQLRQVTLILQVQKKILMLASATGTQEGNSSPC